ncbi:hypothetical protein CHLRE_10g447950v5 [Chlamydomonas reinhardtii]|uniref:Uncharacterized protein n=1 Tax=Chlamydomonas reinhardtii TaxID=3055 RepID=A8HZF9_CHLRE|nr:uncharacterized protein CHLRE_10g447950v5 [Chlamydomonas reinhardtii]PNW77702.1 hypothetical protein CHLRE_10g447950v5 [Chlamydomonas reinhardtii]|eukprot:XP_001698307.1 predicted protein [Chlamydomonas reinhardtii]
MAATQPSSTVPIPGSVNKSIAFRVGRNAAALNQPCFGQSRRMNRVVKARAVKAVGLRQQRKAVSPQSPPSPNQESAMNARTGKVAFGPWLGPFETHPSQDVAGVESPIFSDRKGNTYASLGGSRAPPVQTAATAAALGAKGTAASNAATKELYAMMNKMVQRHAANAPPVSGRAAHWQSGRSGKIMGKHGGGGRCGAPRTINQPRRS